RYRHVDQVVAKSWPYRDRSSVDSGVQLQGERVARDGVRVSRRREPRKDERLAAVIAKTEGAQDLERGFVVSEVRPPKAGRMETVALEDPNGPRDGLALTALIERGVVAVDESVERELDATLGITPEELRMPLQDASRGRPRGSHTVG